MWVWREDMAARQTGSNGWRLDEYGTWTWDEHLPVERAGFGAGHAGPALALLPTPVDGLTDGPVDTATGEETPIFHAVSDDHSRRAGMRRIEGEAPWAAIPEPHPGSGPLPIQHWSPREDDEDDRDESGAGRRLASVPTVPPPPGPRDESPEDELRRRAERRRRPHAAVSGGSGRHALRAEESPTGRHAMGG